MRGQMARIGNAGSKRFDDVFAESVPLLTVGREPRFGKNSVVDFHQHGELGGSDDSLPFCVVICHANPPSKGADAICAGRREQGTEAYLEAGRFPASLSLPLTRFSSSVHHAVLPSSKLYTPLTPAADICDRSRRLGRHTKR